MTTVTVEPLICEMRRQRVILAVDLARVYDVTPRRLNEQVKRNMERFPEDFMFQLTKDEARTLQASRSQNATLKRGQNLKYLPYAFTEHGAVMAANVLHSKRAIAMSVFVVRAFLKLREVMANTDEFSSRLNELERKLATRQDLHEKGNTPIVCADERTASSRATSSTTEPAANRILMRCGFGRGNEQWFNRFTAPSPP